MPRAPRHDEGRVVMFSAKNISRGEAFLANPVWCQTLLIDLADQTGMTLVAGPYTHRFGPRKQDGVSGVVLIAESHIALHTWPEQDALTLVIYSCRDFRAADAFLWLFKAFGRGATIEALIDEDIQECFARS